MDIFHGSKNCPMIDVMVWYIYSDTYEIWLNAIISIFLVGETPCDSYSISLKSS